MRLQPIKMLPQLTTMANFMLNETRGIIEKISSNQFIQDKDKLIEVLRKQSIALNIYKQQSDNWYSTQKDKDIRDKIRDFEKITISAIDATNKLLELLSVDISK